MSEDFLTRLREEPRPEFADELRRRLREIESAEATPASRRRARFVPVLAGAAFTAVVGLAFILPSVGAAARSFLDLFRVKRFAAVPVDPERLTRLQRGGLDLKSLVSEQVEVLEPGRPPEPVAGAEAASAAAGIGVRQPAVLPRGAALAEVAVGHPGAFRVSLDVAKLELVARAVGVEDPDIPASWNGATIQVQAPPVVFMRYHRGADDFMLIQSRNPAIELPEGVDLARLGTLGLRMTGMTPEEARLFARTIDWRNTLLVPIPLQGAMFREVEVRGQKGLLVTAMQAPKAADGAPRPGRWRSVLLWEDGGQIFALDGPGQGIEILEMAQSVH